jgi:hypothetical protein
MTQPNGTNRTSGVGAAGGTGLGTTAPIASTAAGAGSLGLDSHQTRGPVLVFDGGCPFCRHFAELSELRGGIPGLTIRDGRAETALRQQLARRGFHLRDGAMVLDGEQVLHGAAAITWLCERMAPSAALLRLLAPLLGDSGRSRELYPLLLLARRAALGLRRLPVDPDAGGAGPQAPSRP